MSKLSHFSLIILSGITWLIVGVFLMSLGVHFITNAVIDWEGLLQNPQFSFLKLISSFAKDGDQAISVLIVICLSVGYLKGRYVLIKSVKRGVRRLLSLPNPCSIKYIYSKKYYLLILVMVAMGMMIKHAHVALDVRGAVDLTVGAALLKGAILYFKDAFAVKKGSLVGGT